MMTLPMIADPGNRLGESLAIVESQVDGLRNLRNWPSLGDQYVVYHNIEANTSYFFRNGVVIKEVFTYSGNENDATYMFQRFVDDFAGQDYLRATEDNKSVTFYFSRVNVTVSIEHFVANKYLCKVTYTPRQS
ncbi:MAG: hypothetical protein ACI3ZZ_04815 [Candidatus Aphodosoma sp.]